MDKTININLGGTLFQVDEEAFIMLRDYLQAINTRLGNLPGGPETVEDIENRIAEIFQSQRGTAGVITRQNVESMIAIIGKPEDFDLNDETEQQANPYKSATAKRLFRNPDDSVISGVCGGLGAYFNIDPVLFRILFILFTLTFGVGLLIYIALWIAVPAATSTGRKREMYGKNYHAYASGGNTQSGLSNGINEIFNAIGRVFFMIFRIFMIIFGILFVLTGFLLILSYVMVFVFKFPGAFSHEGLSFNISYFPEMMKYFVTPNVAPWITILATIVIILPLIGIIYWGVRMIFWFRVRDGYVNLAAFVIWVVAAASLSIILFSEGISFAERSTNTTVNMLSQNPDTLFVVTKNKIADIQYDEEFSIPDDNYSVFLVDSLRQICIKPTIVIKPTDDKTSKVEVKMSSSGRSKTEAGRRSESLAYNYSINKDTLYVDEYFSIPPGRKWSADEILISLDLRQNTVLYFDTQSAKLVHESIPVKRLNSEEYEYRHHHDSDLPGGKFWLYSEEGLREVERSSPKRK
jgi:phage shock protein PspC (stress-responsive transcriptional regulator)